MADPILRIVVHGTPGTAGSKSAFPIYKGSGADRYFTGRVAVAEKSKGSAAWRNAVLAAAFEQIRCCGDDACHRLASGYPLDEPLVATAVFTVAKPKSAPKTARTWPDTRPDLLKYTRALEDALKAAGVMKDDARIVRYSELAKVYPREDPDALDAPGAVVKIWRMRDLTIWQRDAVAAPAATLFDPIPT